MKLLDAPRLFLHCVLLLVLTACGGSSGNSAGDTGVLQSDETQQSAQAEHQDSSFSCDATLDVADFLITEIDRQWSCEIMSANGVKFNNVYFSRTGTATFNNSRIWYWNRNLPGEEINLAAPDQTSVSISDITSSNTVLSFSTLSATGTSESYDCILVSREITQQ